MELIFQQQSVKLNSSVSTEEIIKKINNLLDKGYYFSHFIADGIEVYDEHEFYLNKNGEHISRLEIIAKTVEEFVNDLLLSTEEYIERANPDLMILAEEFYDNPNAATWERLVQLLEGLQWLDEMLLVIGQSGTVPTNWKAYLTVSAKMQENIQTLSEAVENKDNILIGDIIKYELISVFENLNNEVKQTIDNEGIRHDLN
ncbi:hypothetical protein [Sporosarcina koreensis]|uniref:Uncharacterized protein n=1 Tax=Sporosarcina koreensis TaxID=334735 RepID=A0ABW0U087_9BACL